MNDTTKGMCFLGMPCGRSAAERLAYRQWRKEVLEPAIDGAGYTPWVSELDAAPADIASEILRNVVEAPIAVFDLGGFEPRDAINVNVMYELGIRHAFHKPAIVYSPDQTLPFDVQAGRAILAPRSMDAAPGIRDAIRKAIAEADAGRFWKPMLAVANLDRLHDMLAKSSDLARVIEHLLALSRDVKFLMRERSGLAAVEDSMRRELILSRLGELDVINQRALDAVLSDSGSSPAAAALSRRLRNSDPLPIGTANRPARHPHAEGRRRFVGEAPPRGRREQRRPRARPTAVRSTNCRGNARVITFEGIVLFSRVR